MLEHELLIKAITHYLMFRDPRGLKESCIEALNILGQSTPYFDDFIRKLQDLIDLKEK